MDFIGGKYYYLIAALTVEVLFLILSIIIKIGRGKNSTLKFSKLHLRMTLLFLALSIVKLFVLPVSEILYDIPNLLTGLFLYFGIQYAIVINFWGIATGSVSTSILSLILEKENSITKRDIFRYYACGEGFDKIRVSKFDRLKNSLKWIEAGESGYHLTKKGERTYKIVMSVLKFWNLKQIGA